MDFYFISKFIGGSAAKILNFMKVYWESNNITSPKRYKLSSGKIFEKLLTNKLHSELGYALWIRSYLFVSPNQNLDEYEFCNSQNKTCGFDVDTLMRAVMKLHIRTILKSSLIKLYVLQFFPQSCNDFMSELTFLGRSYDCNEIFKPIKTEMGQCFTANSLHVQ